MVREWTLRTSVEDDWRVVNQIIVPQRLRLAILNLAHDSPMACHLGVNKTRDCILLQLFWPGLKKRCEEIL